MKVIPFTIPVPAQSSLHVQHDVLPVFYPHLHRHREIQITSIIKGHGTLLCGHTMLPFAPGQVFVLGAQQPHVFRSNGAANRKQKGTAESLTVFFDPLGPLQPLLLLPEMSNVQKWMQKYTAGCMYQGKAAMSITGLAQKTAQQKGANRLSVFLALLHTLQQAKPAQSMGHSSMPLSDTAGQRINAVMQFTLQHYTEPIAIATVAQHIHMTAPAFCRYFKQHTGKTYLNFLTELRIQEVCKHLPCTGTIAEAAWAAGFQNISHFNRVFKKHMRQQPGEYMAQLRQY